MLSESLDTSHWGEEKTRVETSARLDGRAVVIAISAGILALLIRDEASADPWVVVVDHPVLPLARWAP